MVQTRSFLSCKGQVGRGGRERKIWEGKGNLLPFEADQQFLPVLKWLKAVPTGFMGRGKGSDCSADLVAHITLLSVLGKWYLRREGMLDDVSVQEVVSCSFFFRGFWGRNYRSLVTHG